MIFEDVASVFIAAQRRYWPVDLLSGSCPGRSLAVIIGIAAGTLGDFLFPMLDSCRAFVVNSQLSGEDS